MKAEGRLLIEASLPAIADLDARGHHVVELPDGDDRFGSIVPAGREQSSSFAIVDGRRRTACRAL
jgi:hypothetical protein